MAYVTTESLKDALTQFRERGDQRWASKSEVEELRESVPDGLTQEDVTEVIQSA